MGMLITLEHAPFALFHVITPSEELLISSLKSCNLMCFVMKLSIAMVAGAMGLGGGRWGYNGSASTCGILHHFSLLGTALVARCSFKDRACIRSCTITLYATIFVDERAHISFACTRTTNLYALWYVYTFIYVPPAVRLRIFSTRI